jgi:hypothetical protein
VLTVLTVAARYRHTVWVAIIGAANETPSAIALVYWSSASPDWPAENS